MTKILKSKSFFSLALEFDALLFGDFQLKSGIKSPYFFNMAAFFAGGALYELASFYADLIIEEGIIFDSIFGPAYKGIPLASAVSSALYQKTNKRVPFSFDRKEEKKHGEGGSLIGAKLSRKILIIDDVLTGGTALSNSIELIQDQGGTVVSAIVGLDREELIEGTLAKKVLFKRFGFPIYSIANTSMLIEFLGTLPSYSKEAAMLKASIV